MEYYSVIKNEQTTEKMQQDMMIRLTLNKKLARYFSSKMGLCRNNKERQSRTCNMVGHMQVHQNQGHETFL